MNEFDRELERAQIPLDMHLRNYFKAHKSLGSHDRKTISETVYKLIRHKVYLDTISPKPLSWDGRLETLLTPRFTTMKDNTSLLPYIKFYKK